MKQKAVDNEMYSEKTSVDWSIVSIQASVSKVNLRPHGKLKLETFTGFH